MTKRFTRATPTTCSSITAPPRGPVAQTRQAVRRRGGRCVRDRSPAGTPTPAPPTATPEGRPSWSAGPSTGSGTRGPAVAPLAPTPILRAQTPPQRWCGSSTSTHRGPHSKSPYVRRDETDRFLDYAVYYPLAWASYSAKPRLEMLCHTAEPCWRGRFLAAFWSINSGSLHFRPALTSCDGLLHNPRKLRQSER